MKTFLPNFNIVELCLTYRCNVKCANCSNLCTQAPFHGDLTPEAVNDFLHDSVMNNHKWKQITIHGGEPCLNPWIEKICAMLSRYKHLENPDCVLWLLSNNSTTEIRKKITYLSCRYEIPLGISTKIKDNTDGSGNKIQYIPVNISPTDSGKDHSIGCFQTQNCGICYNYNGYYGCSPMAASARVFGYKPVAQSIAELKEENILEAFSEHCKHCGFAMEAERITEQESSTFWKEGFKKYGDSCA